MRLVSDEFLQNFNTASIKEEIIGINISGEVKTKIKKEGVPEPIVLPSELLLSYPLDITTVHSRELGKYLAIYQGFASRNRFLLATAQTMYEHGELLLKFVYNKLYEKVNNDPAVKNKKVSIEADNFYLQCSLEVLELKAEVEHLQACLDSLIGYATGISREISNRGHDIGGKRPDTIVGSNSESI